MKKLCLCCIDIKQEPIINFFYSLRFFEIENELVGKGKGTEKMEVWTA
jgi:hypothetical protein